MLCGMGKTYNVFDILGTHFTHAKHFPYSFVAVRYFH